MPSRITGIAWLLLAPLLPIKAQEEALLHINGAPVSLSTFLYQYQQQPAETVDSFLPRFIDYQLQVRCALDNQLDTLSSFRHQLAYCNGKLVESYLAAQSEGVGPKKELLERHFARLRSGQWVKVRHITYPLLQHSSSKLCQEAMVAMQQLKAALPQAASLEEIKEHCSSVVTAPLLVEDLPWKPLSIFLQEWIEPLSQLKVGELSSPFISPVGIHLLLLTDASAEMPAAYSSNESTMSHSIGVPVAGNSLVVGSSCAAWVSDISNHRDFVLRAQEIKEELLVAFLAAHFPSESLVPTEADLAAYFAQHQANYRWQFPHYRGVVVHCKDKSAYKKWRKLLKKLPASMREKALIELTQLSQAGEVSFETGLFQLGQNDCIDKLVFKCGSYTPPSAYPYVFVLGEKLKQPSSYHDVKEALLLDYKVMSDGLWLDSIRQKYTVELEEEVLKTVNNSASN
ncbi:MAG: peptidylprolyl isomerase [Phocaeicola sp.]